MQSKCITIYLSVIIFFQVSFINNGYTLQHLGTEYGGWTIPVELLTEHAVCYCFGAGEDISFEIELVNTIGCAIYCFDPTPRALEHFQYLHETYTYKQRAYINKGDRCYTLLPQTLELLYFYPYGLWNKNEAIKFYYPKNEAHVSCSGVNLQNTTTYFVAQCKELCTIMEELGHTHIDLLKMDIEGAEYCVLLNMLFNKIFPKILCIEFHKTRSYSICDFITLLTQHGYSLSAVKKTDYTFVLL